MHKEERTQRSSHITYRLPVYKEDCTHRSSLITPQTSHIPVHKKERSSLITPHTSYIPVHNCFVCCVRNESSPWSAHSHLFPFYCLHNTLHTSLLTSNIIVHKEERAQRSSLITAHTMNHVKMITWEQMWLYFPNSYVRVCVWCEEWWARSAVHALRHVIILRYCALNVRRYVWRVPLKSAGEVMNLLDVVCFRNILKCGNMIVVVL